MCAGRETTHEVLTLHSNAAPLNGWAHTGARPAVGAAAAKESLETIKDMMRGKHLVFIAAGLGGGTGSGAAPVP